MLTRPLLSLTEYDTLLIVPPCRGRGEAWNAPMSLLPSRALTVPEPESVAVRVAVVCCEHEVLAYTFPPEVIHTLPWAGPDTLTTE